MDVNAIAASGMQQDLQQMNTIGQNLANVLTPGYKKQVVVGAAFQQQVAGLLQPGAGVPAPLQSIDPSAGPMRYTGGVHDAAVEGPEFFEVAGPDGPAYTRQGNFHTDVRGRLVTAQGWPVQGQNGDIVVSGPYTIETNGELRQDGRVVARLKLAAFSNPAAMTPAGGGLYQQGGAARAEGAVVPRLRIGYQENSNVSSPQEMVRLSETVRHFEALQKIMQGYDEVLEKTIRKLGEF